MKRIIYPVLVLMLSAGIFIPQNAVAQKADKKEAKVAAEAVQDSSDVNEQRINWDKVLKDWSVGIHAGVTMPYTDVRSYDWFRKAKPINEYQYTVGASITKMMGHVFGIQARYNYGKLQGYSNYESDFTEDVQFWEIVGIDNPFFFNTNFHQPSINLYVNFSNMFMSLNRKIRANIKDQPIKERKVSVYGRAGFGAIWFDSQLKDIVTKQPVGNQFVTAFC